MGVAIFRHLYYNVYNPKTTVLMRNPFTLYEQEVMSALYKSLNYCEENDLPTYEITKALSSIEDRLQVKEVV
tara:strand:+ start:242 stop:457 length:216 start_codon:yes stop_codon:yes gene_type:complete